MQADMTPTERIKVILRRGRENALTARAIAREAGMDDGQSNLGLRQILKALLRSGYPVISCEQGFFIARTEDELADYTKSLKVRIMGLQSDIHAVETIQHNMFPKPKSQYVPELQPYENRIEVSKAMLVTIDKAIETAKKAMEFDVIPTDLSSLLPAVCSSTDAICKTWLSWFEAVMRKEGEGRMPTAWLSWLQWACQTKCCCAACVEGGMCSAHTTLDTWVKRGGKNPCL